MTNIRLSNIQIGTLYAIASGICYCPFGYFGMRVLHEGYSVECLTFWRFLISTAIMYAISLNNIKAISSNKRQALKAFLCGMFVYYPGAIFYFTASEYIGTGLAIVIYFTFPAIVVFLNVFLFKFKVQRIYYISAALILVGMTLLVELNNLRLDISGITLSFLSAITYAIYIIICKSNKISSALFSFLICAGAATGGLIWGSIGEKIIIPQYLIFLDIAMLSILCTVMPLLLTVQSLKYISSERAAVLSVLEPISIVLVGVVVLGEMITMKQIFGIIVILAGAIVITHSKNE